MRVVGIDVGYAITGWSVIDEAPSKTNKMELVEYGVILTDSKLEISTRLKIVFDELDILLKKYKPACMAVEDIFYFKNQKTIINVSQVRGVILLAGEVNGVELVHYTPLQVKTAVSGYGRAEKAQVQKMIKLIFGLKEIPKPDDAADAIAIGICHLNSYKLKNIIKKQNDFISKRNS